MNFFCMKKRVSAPSSVVAVQEATTDGSAAKKKSKKNEENVNNWTRSKEKFPERKSLPAVTKAVPKEALERGKRLVQLQRVRPRVVVFPGSSSPFELAIVDGSLRKSMLAELQKMASVTNGEEAELMVEQEEDEDGEEKNNQSDEDQVQEVEKKAAKEKGGEGEVEGEVDDQNGLQDVDNNDDGDYGEMFNSDVESDDNNDGDE